MAWTDYYLDLAAGSNGTGTSGSPWNTWANAATGMSTISVATRLNVKGNVSTGSVTFSPSTSAATGPLWIRGCDSSWNPIGETQSGQPTTTMTSNGSFTCQSQWIVWTGLAWTGSSTGAIFTMSGGAGGRQHFDRCSFTNTGTGANSYAFSGGANTGVMTRCSVSASTTTATYALSATSFYAYDCIFSGGATGTVRSSSTALFLSGCVLKNIAGTGVLTNAGSQAVIYRCSFLGNANSKGIDLTTGTGLNHIFDCVFSGFSGTGVAISSSATSGLNALLRNNRFYNCATNISGIIESFQLGPDDGSSALAGDPFTSSTDFTPTSYITGGGTPGVFQGQSFTSYPASGAVQPSSAGGGAVLSRVFAGF